MGNTQVFHWQTKNCYCKSLELGHMLVWNNHRILGHS